MSATDDRIVSMHFSNAQFQKNVADTLKSLDDLKRNLNFQGATQALGDLDAAGSKFNMGNIGTTIEGVSGKFLALGTIAVTALANITTKAIDAGAKMVKALAISPIMEGFGEYEVKIGSIQTILANTARHGTKLPEVEANLEKLNEYADRTIYNFGDMTKNIGLFTNAGIKVGDATSMIKGFSNAAAASGTTAEGAAGAAYQLSQALSAGQIRLMDWRSLTNVGMGNKNMQDSLIQLAQGMGVFKETGDDAKEVQKDFNASLESGWLKADVMSAYLRIMAGDMSDAEMKSKGLTAAQIKGFRDQAKTADEAATKVRTFSQFMTTLKESVGSGWAETFGIVFGNFEGATELFTRVSGAVGHLAERFSDSRNELLKGWDKLGGRKILIEALAEAGKNLGNVFKAIKDAFTEIFPPKTSKQLFDMTKAFADFINKLHLNDLPLEKIHTSFMGLFAVFSIGWEILKNVGNLFQWIFSTVFKGAGGGVLDFTAKLGGALVSLQEFLVKGGGIADFFEKIRVVLADIGGAIGGAIEKIVSFFSVFASSKTIDAAGDSVGRVGDRIQNLGDAAKAALEWLGNFFEGVKDVVGKIWGYISDFFSNIGQAIANSMKSGNFDTAIDVINVGLLGGIILMLKKFISGGLKLDFGQSGLVEKIQDMLNGVTDTLKAMQAQLKAKALKDIAIAMGVLTASVVVLSLLDSAALARALSAMAVGFGQLVGVMALLDKINATGPGKLALLTGGLIAIAGAGVILAGAVRLLATLSWDELGRGLAGLTGALAVFMGAIKLLGEQEKITLGGALSIFTMASALKKLAKVMVIFSTLSWEDLSKGMAGVTFALGVLVGAMHLLPPSGMLALVGVGMIGVATAMLILAGVIKLFSLMSPGELATGIIAVGAALGAIALSVGSMPPTLPLIAIGLVLLSGALTTLAGVIAILGRMKVGTLIKGIVALAAVLAVLAIGMAAMQTALPGAAATIVASVALMMLAKVIRTLGKMDLKVLAIGIGAIAAVLGVLGIAAALMTPVIPALFSLGIALGTIGIAFALFGVGAYLAAKAFEAVAKAGKAGIAVIIEAIVEFIKAIPKFVKALVGALVESAGSFMEAGEKLISLAVSFLTKILEAVIKLAPKIARAIMEIVDIAIVLIREKVPELIETGFVILTAFLKGLRDHITDLTTLAVDIVTKLVNGIADNMQKLVDAAVNLLTAFVKAFSDRSGEIVGAGLGILLALIKGVAENLIKVINLAGDIIASLVTAIGNNVWKVVNAGANAIVKFLEGIGNNVNKVIDAGADLVLNIAKGISRNINKVVDEGAKIIIDFVNKLADTIRQRAPELQKAFLNLADAIFDGLTMGLADKAKKVAGPIGGFVGGLIKEARDKLGSNSPSKVFMDIAKDTILGFVIGTKKNAPAAEASIVDAAEQIVRSFAETLSKVPDALSGMDEMNPVITPVLDLTKVQNGARNLNDLMKIADLSATLSLNQARQISSATNAENEGDSEPVPVGSSEIKFEQNIYSPTPLSANDVYRNTKSQLALAKEELKI